MPFNKVAFGALAEDRAAEYLTAKGYTIVERNFRFLRGEIDIVCRDPKGLLVFAEVRATLAAKPLGDPETWFTAAKRAQLKKMAGHYYYARQLGDVPGRIDFLAVEMEKDTCEIRHYQNAVGM
jgi:putative endonuclease